MQRTSVAVHFNVYLKTLSCLFSSGVPDHRSVCGPTLLLTAVWLPLRFVFPEAFGQVLYSFLLVYLYSVLLV